MSSDKNFAEQENIAAPKAILTPEEHAQVIAMREAHDHEGLGGIRQPDTQLKQNEFVRSQEAGRTK